MKRLLTCIFFLIAAIFVSKAENDDFSLEHVKNIGLKVIHITTANHEEPTCDYLEAPEGCMGMTIANATKVPCRIVITQQSDTLYDSGEYEKSVSGAIIKINGNTTAYFSKNENKPYKIKLQKKTDLLFRHDERFSDKEWRLLKDGVSLNTIIGLKISELLNFPWTPAYSPCNVFINGDYQGCYLLIESVKRNKDCRLNVDKETGYIVERDAYWWKEDKYFSTDYFASNKAYRWTWKYPDKDAVDDDQENYIRQFINSTEESIKNGTYPSYIDIVSFARWILSQDILGIYDSGGTNLYLTKYDNTPSSLLQMPVLWDFDSNFSIEAGQFSRIHNASYDYYFYDLFNSDNKEFTIAYKQLWDQVRPSLLNSISDFIQHYMNSEEGKALTISSQLNIKRWHYEDFPTLEEFATAAINWFENHLPLLDKNIQQLDDRTSILSISKRKKNNVLYNLTGQKVLNPQKGIYINQNGRKIIYLP